MRGVAGLVGLLLTLWIGYRIYSMQAGGTEDAAPIIARVDAAGVRSDLLSLAQAERYHLVTYGTYASLEQLQKSAPVSNLPQSPRRGYSYSIETDGSRHFLITAQPDKDRTDLPVLSIDETMTVRP